ncbi:6-phosphogluconolactonase [Limimaricola variabilis]|uniref:6-phosphogluconolactonase n=1 Tax=Limimaricola variabilis TaxID=1492771 RepID=A0ABR6HK70_9RHOB|nr:6-phosphogluconolactonase [Limimaricola variabilis]MBB3710950.1 6-phosphogluconolactonase [Limimaricola variabilis]WPY95501.1 6-phosphogluconolactonase [Limimaricola variabilis]
MEFVEYADSEMMMIDLADRLASELRAAIAADGRASLAVPGGTTPGPIFDTLSAIGLDWDKVHVMLTDERWVPEDSERSNTGLLKRRLFTGAAAAAHYLPLYAPAERPEEKLDALQEALAPHLPLSVVLLGMGADMHTASIFPGADQLDAALNGDATLVAMRAPGAPEPRITLSAKVLNDAMRRHIVIIGAEKRAALEKAQGLSPEEAPVAAVLKGATVHWAES